MIGVDCEGVACAVGAAGKGLGEGRNADFARLQATREASAAAEALFEAGAEQVIVWDNHGPGVNLDYDRLDRRCEIALGRGFENRWPSVDENFSGVLLIGYHPMDNTPDGVLAHTFWSSMYQWIKINGVEIGEIAADAAAVGERGVPVVFVASDEAGAAEAKRFLPWVETVATKRGFGWNAAISKHPQRACEEIRQGVTRAVKRLGEMKAFTFDAPMTVEIRYKRLEDAERVSRGQGDWTRTDPYTVSRQVERLGNCF